MLSPVSGEGGLQADVLPSQLCSDLSQRLLLPVDDRDLTCLSQQLAVSAQPKLNITAAGIPLRGQCCRCC